MNKENCILGLAHLVYALSLILFLTQGIFRDTLLVSASETNQYLVIIRSLYLSSLALLAVKILFFQNYRHSAFFHSIFFWLFSILFGISTWISRNPAIFSVWLFAVANADRDFDSSVRITFVTEILLISIIVVLSFVGVLPTETYPPAPGHPYTRYSFGFLHPNSMGLYTFHVASCFIYLRRKKSVLPSFLVLMGITLFNYFITSSRTSFIASSLLLICLVLYSFLSGKSKKNSQQRLQSFSRCLIIASATAIIASMVLSFSYSQPLVQKVDYLFSGRFFYVSKALSANGISWFGKPPFSIGGPFDNSYMWILLHFGILTYMSVSVLLILLLCRLYQNKQYLEIMILFVYACYAMMESEVFVANKCIFVLMFGFLLSNRTSH